jgi:hypothetical protein
MPKRNHMRSIPYLLPSPIISADRAALYARLHDFMYRESIRTGQTPIPPELADQAEWLAFCHWKHLNWLRLARAAADQYMDRLDREEALRVAETP